MKQKQSQNSSKEHDVSLYAEKIGCNGLDLLRVMAFESGLNPSIRGGANNAYVGLIQFSNTSAKEIGTTQNELVKMDFDTQMKFVVKYFQMWRKRLNLTGLLSLSDLYLIVLYPSAVKIKAMDEPLKIAGKQAKMLYNKGVITRRSIENALKNYFTSKFSSNGLS